MRYDFYLQLGVDRTEFDSLSEDKQLDQLYDIIDELCLAGKWEEVNAIYAEFDPEEHPLSLSIGMLTIGNIPFQQGKIPKPTWRALYHRVKYHAIELGRNWQRLLLGFPTGYLHPEIETLVVALGTLKTDADQMDCRIGDDPQGDPYALHYLANGIRNLEEAIENFDRAAKAAREREVGES